MNRLTDLSIDDDPRRAFWNKDRTYLCDQSTRETSYFRYPQLNWPGTFRPFQDYGSHLSLIAIYTLNEGSIGRIEDLELIVHETWRIGSRQRSSTTREYIGAVVSIDDLRAGKGDFGTEQAFYAYWRKFPFRIGRTVQQQLDKLLRDQRKV